MCECGQPLYVKKAGLCKNCYQRAYAQKQRSIKDGPLCTCGRPVYIKKYGLCSPCYQRAWLRGDIPPRQKVEQGPCLDCDRQATHLGRCNACGARRKRAQRGAIPRPSRRLNAALLDEGECDYQSAHRRVVRMKGRAADHVCACGTEAKAWSYIGGSPDEQRGTIAKGRAMPMRWCGDTTYYIPECNPCHKQRDSAQRVADRVQLFQLLDAMQS